MSIKIQAPPTYVPTAEQYIMSDALRNAVEVAIALNQPLLLTGEPGTGKTRLAYKLAADLAQQTEYNFADEPLVFNTKTSSTARDLFYTYDALAHFQAANIDKATQKEIRSTAEFIELQALGKAIANCDPKMIKEPSLAKNLAAKAQSSVVLIDEIDKAPRDFPNDILAEIERYEFSVKELSNYSIQKSGTERLVVIMTSNSEKNLPDAFLRRCVFYHIPFPSSEELLAIAKSQLGTATQYTDTLLQELIKHFNDVRRQAARKPPATAELIAWLRILEMHDIMGKSDEEQKMQMRNQLAVLVKTKEDMDAVRSLFA